MGNRLIFKGEGMRIYRIANWTTRGASKPHL